VGVDRLAGPDVDDVRAGGGPEASVERRQRVAESGTVDGLRGRGGEQQTGEQRNDEQRTAGHRAGA
jgi:hypothetical protein